MPFPAVVASPSFLTPVVLHLRGRLRLGLFFVAGAIVVSASASASGVDQPKLVRTTLALAPTAAQLDTVPSFPAAWWLVPGLARDLNTALAGAGFSPGLAQRLHAAVRLQHDGSGLISPEVDWLDAFTPAERQRWHALLALHTSNRSYRWPLVVRTAVLDDLEKSAAMTEAVRRIRQWGTPIDNGNRLRFGDLFAIEEVFMRAADRRAFFRAVLTTETLFLKLDVGADGDGVGQAAAYWHEHGRYRAIQPFYDAVRRVRDHDRIDVTHLLPQFARGLLHTFPPDFSATADLAIESNLLAAGFFTVTPDEPLPLDEGFFAWLSQECAPVTDGLRYGDILVYEDPARTRWPYAAVYVADGLVLSRRPTLFGAWSFMERSMIARLNPRLGAITPSIHRRRSAHAGEAGAPFRHGAPPPSWAESARLRTGNAGPWGRIVTYDVLLAPSGEHLERLPEPQRDPEWTLLIDDHAALLDDIAAMEMPTAVREGLNRLLARARWQPGRTLTLRPHRDLVFALPAMVRARLFRHLVTGGDTYAQTMRIATTLPAERWFPPEVLPEPARSAVLGLTYPLGRGFALSDYGALFSVLPVDREDRLTALRAVFRTPALVALLEKPAPEDVPALAAYWRLDQQKSVTTLLESFAANEGARYLDVVHLLTPLARELLNLYTLADGDAPAASCYWTALNFDAVQPDPRLLVLPTRYGTQATYAWEKLRTEYVRVDTPGRLGDIVAYRERSGRRDLLHVCAFIADDLVFTKNGIGLMAPWCLMRLENVDALYLDDVNVERLTFRRKE